MNKLAQALNERGVLLADGATGTNFFAMGLEAGEAPEVWNFEFPEKVRALHKSFVDAGSDIILTNTFGANRHRLKLHGLEDRVEDLNRRAAELARTEADSAGRTVLVGGSIGPTGELLVPLGELTYEGAVEAFEEQVAGLVDGGVDILWIETMSAPDEMRAAVEAAAKTDLPFTVTASFDTAGKTMMGLAPAGLGDLMGEMATPPAAYGANCGVGASDLLVSVLDMTRNNAQRNCHRQGQLRHSPNQGRQRGIYRHAGADERLRQTGGRCRRQDHRRLLRQFTGACGGDAGGNRRTRQR